MATPAAAVFGAAVLRGVVAGRRARNWRPVKTKVMAPTPMVWSVRRHWQGARRWFYSGPYHFHGMSMDRPQERQSALGT
ncbi:MAG: hypothetical protein AB7K09_13105 [Planctomycetota bacterium]